MCKPFCCLLYLLTYLAIYSVGCFFSNRSQYRLNIARTLNKGQKKYVLGRKRPIGIKGRQKELPLSNSSLGHFRPIVLKGLRNCQVLRYLAALVYLRYTHNHISFHLTIFGAPETLRETTCYIAPIHFCKIIIIIRCTLHGSIGLGHQ